jgi:hypothetical protein
VAGRKRFIANDARTVRRLRVEGQCDGTEHETSKHISLKDRHSRPLDPFDIARVCNLGATNDRRHPGP